jgi:hypothetical protein
MQEGSFYRVLLFKNNRGDKVQSMTPFSVKTPQNTKTLPAEPGHREHIIPDDLEYLHTWAFF